jgi:hypothetical protein
LTDPYALVGEVVQAATRNDPAAVRTAVDQAAAAVSLGATRMPPGSPVMALKALRRKRYFDEMSMFAEAMLQTGHDDEATRITYAQALIDSGRPTAALAMLRDLEEAGPDDTAEVEGLIGRAHKQMYVARAAAPVAKLALGKAIGAYHRAYAEDPERRIWHGVNTAALLARARQDDVVVPGYPSPEEIAEGVLATIEAEHAATGAVEVWDLATAAEACVVLGRYDDAAGWLARYVDPAQGADAFELASTQRQFIEVWRFDPASEPGALVLPMLQAAILERSEESRVEVEAAEVATDSTAPALERVLGHAGMVSLQWYRLGLARGRAVALISSRMGEPTGTGFIVDGAALADGLRGPVLVTNSHVIDPDRPEALHPEDAVVSFQEQGDGASGVDEYQVDELIWSSPPDRLDTSVVRLAGDVDGRELCPTATRMPRNDGKQRVYVIGHPQGRALSYSIDDNALLDYDDRVMHYRAPTEPGSSGSPVFNRNWDVVGLHHAGSLKTRRLHGEDGTYAANEGIRLEAIREVFGS